MHAPLLAFLLQTAVVARALLLMPFEGRRRYARLSEAVESDAGARLRFYARAVGTWWLLAAAVGLAALLTPQPGFRLGAPGPGGVALVVAWGLVLLVPVLRVRGSPELRDAIAEQLRRIPALLPRTRRERVAWVAVSLTAGICEELVFRGLVPVWVRALAPVPGLGALVSIVGFGVAHAYQGRRGMLLTGVVGAIFHGAMALTGSLYVAMAMHALLDLRLLALLSVAGRPLDNSPGSAP